MPPHVVFYFILLRYQCPAGFCRSASGLQAADIELARTGGDNLTQRAVCIRGSYLVSLSLPSQLSPTVKNPKDRGRLFNCRGEEYGAAVCMVCCTAGELQC